MAAKSLLMIIAWLSFYAFNWFMIFNLPAEHPVFYVFVWILFATIAVASTGLKGSKEE